MRSATNPYLALFWEIILLDSEKIVLKYRQIPLDNLKK